MFESYDRRKTAATIDLHSKWDKINDSLKKTEEREFKALLKSLVPYMRSVGYDLDLQKSYISRYWKGSDGWWMEGTLYVTSRDENTTKEIDFGPIDGARRVKEWIKDAIGFTPAQVKHVKGNTWMVDITSV